MAIWFTVRIYEPFGDNPKPSFSVVGTSRGFTGQEQDDDTGLLNMVGRIYDPLTSRFTTPNQTTEAPLSSEKLDRSLPVSSQGLNGYSYGLNNPLRFSDPTGLLPVEATRGSLVQPDWAAVSRLSSAVLGAINALTPTLGSVPVPSARHTGQNAGAANVNSNGALAIDPAAMSSSASGPTHGVRMGPEAASGPRAGSQSGANSGAARRGSGSRSATGQRRSAGESAAGGKSCCGPHSPSERLRKNENFANLPADVQAEITIAQAKFTAELIAWEIGGSLALRWAAKSFRLVAGALRAARGAQRTVIGKLKDLGSLKPGENTLLKHLPDQGSVRGNWAQNSGVLRREMGKGVPLRDASVSAKTGDLIRSPGSFLEAERNLLQSRGWTYNPSTTLWSPP